MRCSILCVKFLNYLKVNKVIGFILRHFSCRVIQRAYLTPLAEPFAHLNQNKKSHRGRQLKVHKDAAGVFFFFLQCGSCLRKHRKLCSLYSPNPQPSPRKIAPAQPAGPVITIYDFVRVDRRPGSVLPSNLTCRERVEIDGRRPEGPSAASAARVWRSARRCIDAAERSSGGDAVMSEKKTKKKRANLSVSRPSGVFVLKRWGRKANDRESSQIKKRNPKITLQSVEILRATTWKLSQRGWRNL